MRWSRTLTMVEAHCEGEIGKVVTGGVIDVPGETMLDKMIHINTVDDSIRRFAVFEPRGCLQMSVNLLLPPTRPEADAAFIILQADQAHAMSGSNCICVTTVLLETGMVPMTEPETTVVLETPAGLVTALATCRDGRCERVSLDMVPSFADTLDLALDVPGIGPVTAEIAFGGVYYVLVEASQVGLAIEPAAARNLAEVGVRVKRAADTAVAVRHPVLPGLDSIAYTMFYSASEDDPTTFRTSTVLPPGRLDRSPCGTGSSALLAVLHARGRAKTGDRLRTRSAIGSEFQVDLLGETLVGERTAVRPRITGRGWIHGLHQIGVDPSDPFPLGFTVADTWGEDVAAVGRQDDG